MLFLVRSFGPNSYALARDTIVSPPMGRPSMPRRARGVEAIALGCRLTCDGIDVAEPLPSLALTAIAIFALLPARPLLTLHCKSGIPPPGGRRRCDDELVHAALAAANENRTDHLHGPAA